MVIDATGGAGRQRTTGANVRRRPRFTVAVRPQLDLDIQIGPTGRKLLPLTVKNGS